MPIDHNPSQSIPLGPYGPKCAPREPKPAKIRPEGAQIGQHPPREAQTRPKSAPGGPKSTKIRPDGAQIGQHPLVEKTLQRAPWAQEAPPIARFLALHFGEKRTH